MATEYRDIGRLNGSTNLNIPTETPKSQVFRATHDEGGTRLPYRYRSFISFSYNGRWIEDFDLIATVDGDRMSKGLTGQFEDLTASNSVVDGEYYNSTRYRGSTLSFSLATDGIDSRKIEDFINWFQPGKNYELVLSEHPNRGIMARVAEPPVMEMLPFEKQIDMTIGGVTYTTSVTNFKGTISLTFAMADPFWYSIINLFGTVDANGNYIETWDGVDFSSNSLQAQDKFKDILKIVYEDGIPVRQMIASPMIFGNDIYATSGNSITTCVVQTTTEAVYNANSTVTGYYNNGLEKGLSSAYYYGAVAEDAANPTYTKGIISGAHTARLDTIHLSLPKDQYIYLYYAGTAPAPIKFTFTIPIIVGSSGYITSIASKIHPQNNKVYNTITFECLEKQNLYVTTPNFLTSYNKVMLLLKSFAAGQSWETLRSLIRDEIRHPVIRAIAIGIINVIAPVTTVSTPFPTTTQVPEGKTSIDPREMYAVTNDKIIYTGIEGTTKIGYYEGTYSDWMTTYGEGTNISYTQSTSGFVTAENLRSIQTVFKTMLNDATLTVTIDSRTGEAIGTFKYHYINGNQATTSLVTLEENVGDMFNSNYIKLKDRNLFTNDLRILAWTNNAKQNSYRIYHDFGNSNVTVTLTNIEILYKNLYF